MKRIVIILILYFSIARAQDASAPLVKNKLSLTYGIIFIQPDEINNHITGSNDALGSSARIIESLPEASVLYSIRPKEESQIITARVGRMYITRIYDVSIPETTTSSTSVASTTGTIKETYTMYPMSLGVGVASNSFGSQAQFELIYGLGYIDEDQSYFSSTGANTTHSRTLSSSAYGFRFAGSTTVEFSERIGLTMEASYRYLVFSDYQDQVTGRIQSMKFSTSGLGGSIGLSILF
jgi:hypothetical protein